MEETGEKGREIVSTEEGRYKMTELINVIGGKRNG